VVRIGQGDLQRSISDVNGLVSEGVDALAIIPDWGKSQLPSLRAATDAGVKVVHGPPIRPATTKIMSPISIGTSIMPAPPGPNGWPRRCMAKVMSCFWAAPPAIQ
jgi:hypothetical protein